jgi:cytochrome c553
MRLTLIILPLVLALVIIDVRAEDDPERGGELYAPCAACHGAQGEGNPGLRAPRLTHLSSVYIVAQLQKFKAGYRGGNGASDSARQMAAMAATLADDQAMYDTAAYIGTLQGGVSPVTIKADVEQGARYYRQYCAACHGPGAQGNPALNSPRLAGADDWYIVTQLQSFRAGSRGSDASDRTGKQMRAMAGVLPDDDAVAAVAAYIRSLEE